MPCARAYGHYRGGRDRRQRPLPQGARVEVDCFPHEFDKLRAEATNEGDFVWVGLYKPSEGELGDVAKAFELHPLAVEDAVKAHQRPKLERYDDSLFLILKTLWYVDDDDAVETGEINIFAGHDFVITVRHGRAPSCTRRGHGSRSTRRCSPTGPSAVIYAVCDPSSTATSTSSTSCRSTSTRSRRRSSPPSAPTTRPASTCSSARSPRSAARCCRCASRSASSRTGWCTAWSARPGRSSATSSTTSTRPRRSSTAWTRCCRPPSTPTWPGSPSSRTTTCARSPPAPRWSSSRPSSPASTA